MIKTFEVSLEHFVIQEGKALPSEGIKPLGNLSAEELFDILEILRSFDVSQSHLDDPHVAIKSREGRYLVHTLSGRLMLYNLRSQQDPALVLETKALIAEVDGSAEKARNAQLRAAASFNEGSKAIDDTSLPYIPPPKPSALPFPWKTFAVAMIAVAGAIVSIASSEGADFPKPDSIILNSAEVSTRRDAVAGVYLTGDTPGHHGFVINTDGSIRLFQINRQLPPSILHDTYEFAYQKGQLCLSTHQPGGLILIKDQDTLFYCDEFYRRVH